MPETKDLKETGNCGKPEKKEKRHGRNHKTNGKPDFPKKPNGNDVSWYKNYPELFGLVTNVQKFKVTGNAEILSTFLPTLENPSAGTISNGGVVSICLQPTVGTCLDANDPINKMSLTLFNKLRGRYTSNVPFQPSDLAAVIVAFGSVVACIGEIKRDLNIVNQKYPLENTAYPELLAYAGCFDLADLRKNYASYLYQLEMQIKRLNMISIPGEFDYFKKMAWAARYIYVDDHAGVRGNYYIQRWDKFYQFRSDVPVVDDSFVAQTAKASGLGLVANTTSTANTIQDKLNILDLLISSLVDDDSVRQISGWMRDKLSTTTVSGFDVLTKIDAVPERNEIMNLYTMNLVRDYMPAAVGKFVSQNVNTQCLVDVSCIVSKELPTTIDAQSLPAVAYVDGLYLSYPSDPDADLIMEASRGICGYIQRYIDNYTPTGKKSLLKTTDVVSVIHVDYLYKPFTNGTIYHVDLQPGSIGVNYVDADLTIMDGSENISSVMISKLVQDLDLRTIAYTYISTDSAELPKGVAQYNRNEFNVFESFEQIHQMHTVATWSMFFIPSDNSQQ